jgi:beta-lactamase regulating signal transducer with metallopeptidase domain
MTLVPLETLSAWVWDASWHAAVVVAIVLMIRRLAGSRLPPAWRCGLWTLVAARLVLFVAPQASWSLFSLIDHHGPANATPPASPVVPTPRASSAPQVAVEYGPVPLAAEPTRATAVKELSTGAATLPISRLIALLWIVGAAAMVLRTALARRNLKRRLSGANAVKDPDVLAVLADCCALMGVRRPVELFETAAVTGPALSGIRRPRVLLPPGLCTCLHREQLRFVLLHEMAHLRRHDVLVEWLIALLTAVHWFNPAVWLAAYCYRADREMSRDEMVLRATDGQDRHRYGHALLHLIEILDPSHPQPLAVAMLDGKRGLKQRINLIANLRPTPARITVIVLVALFAVVATLVLTNPMRVANGPASTATSPHPTENSDDAILQAQLDRRLPEIRFSQQPLDEVIDFLRDLSGARIFVNWRALEAAGIKKNSPISARMRDVRLAKAIDVILADAGGGNVKLKYVQDGGVITISTADDLPTPLETRVYEVHDLVVPIPDYRSDPDRALGRRGATMTTTTRPVEPQMTQAQITSGLMKLIRETNRSAILDEA